MTDGLASEIAELEPLLKVAARKAEGRCGVLIRRTAIGLIAVAPNDRVPKRQIWTTWGTKIAMKPDWPDA